MYSNKKPENPKVKPVPDIRKIIRDKISQIREHELILFALCVVGIIFSFLNPLWYSHAPGFDASVYALFGKMWAHGEIPYQDMIDVKGPGIYLINMIGYRIGGYPGIAFIETLFLVFGIVSVDLALRLFKFSPLSRFCSIVMVISLLGLRYYYGDMVEDYAVYLAMIASYPFALLFSLRRFNWTIGLIPAFAFAFTTSIHFNNGAYFIAWYAMLFLFYCSNGSLLNAVKLALSVVEAMLTVFGGYFLYFYSEGGMELVNNVVFYSIVIHFNEQAYNLNIPDLSAGFVGFVRTGLWIILAGFVWLMFSKDNLLFVSKEGNDRRWFFLYLGFGIIATIVANSLTGHIYDHYDQLYLPFMFIPLAFLMHRYLHVKQDIHISFLTILFLLVFLVSEHAIWEWNRLEWEEPAVYIHAGINAGIALFVCLSIFILRRWLGFYRHNHTVFLVLSIFISFIISMYALTIGHTIGVPWDESTAKKVKIVNENTEINDKIWVEGNMYQYYIWADRTTASPYLITTQLMAPYDFKTKVLNSLNYFKPKFIIVREKSVDDFRAAEKKNQTDRFSAQEQAFARFLRTNYEEVVKGLYKYRKAPEVVIPHDDEGDLHPVELSDKSESVAENGNSEKKSEAGMIKADTDKRSEAKTETPAPELKAAETPAPELKAVETPAPELKAVETPAPELKAVETPAPELKAAETPAPELKAVETPAPELKATETPALKAVEVDR